MDLAEIVEELRGILRGLCTGALRLPVEEAYGENVADAARLRELASRLERRLDTLEPEARSEAVQGVSELTAIADRLEASPARPSGAELCRRYSEGVIDARTVLYITGWSLDRLHDECANLPEPPVY